MARTDRDDMVVVPPLDPAPPGGSGAAAGGRVPRRTVSTGHVVMIVAGLVAALLTYSVLRQAGGKGTEVLVAGRALTAGQTLQRSMLTTTTIKASSAVIGSNMVTPAQESSLIGETAAVDVPSGQLIAPGDFSSATPLPSRTAVMIDQAEVPGGISSVKQGATIDVTGLTANGIPLTVPGLQVLSPPVAPAGSALSGAPATVQIELAVPNTTLMDELLLATQSKFIIRVTDPGAPAGPDALPSGAASGSS
ncbi:MAG TPA: SAF domain-containing protein [Actinomycetota bacterium]|nr:SAF domain-containing protein [Actinomycetota bacterium]